MDIRILENNEIDKIKWDSKIDVSEKNIFLYSWVWDTLHPGWKALIINDYDSFMPLPFKIKFGMDYYFQPMFIREIPILYKNESEKKHLFEFIKANLKLVHLNFNHAFDHSNSKGIYQWLPLNLNYEEITKNYKTNTKRILKKTNDNLILNFDLSLNDFMNFFKSVKEDVLGHLNDKVFERLTVFLSEAIKQKKAYIVSAYLNKELISAAIFIENNGTIYFMKGTSNEIGRKEGALYFIIDYIIKNNCINKNRLDFVGSNNNSIAEFYRKFGAIDGHYDILKWNKIKTPLKFFIDKWMP